MSVAPLRFLSLSCLVISLVVVAGGCIPPDDELPELPFSALEEEVNKGNVIRIRIEPKVTVAECTLVPEAAKQSGIEATMFQVKLPAPGRQRIAFVTQCGRQGVSLIQYHH